jgi:hypothetical protein
MNNVSDANLILQVGKIIYELWWIIFPTIFFYVFKILWIDFSGWYSIDSWYNSQEWILLEVVPPREIEKGPQLMENFFVGLSGVLTTYNTFDEYLKGAWYHDRFGLELVGVEGKIHFYIRTQKKYRNMIEAQIYAQYPDAEIVEAPDYTENFPEMIPNKNWDLWGTDFEFINKDPIPIKTYDKFEESITGEMIDPMSAIAEVLGKLGPGQHIWLQYILQPLPEQEFKKYEALIKKLKGEIEAKSLSYLDHLTDVAANIPKGIFSEVSFKSSEKKEQQPLEFRLSPMEKEILKETEENLGRNLFKTKMRFIYLARKENFDKASIGTFIGAIKQFNDINLNSVKPNDRSKTYGVILNKEKRADFRKRKIYDRYKKRNVDGAKMFFSTKELATMFHFPDMGVKSPAVLRTTSKLGSAPANLPVE